ncbi:hypothetical protein NLJ89_g10161 [Agrocybe chaxingu]|uniref:Uncharacterized protein n=1 Tax=Agrocybe chaxingu TaxID=84603 RepID=A0A9W8MSW4_9AGAR|nr:hypothetical protein NLJ89_g10161 [Agrocybe chaxingu]
MPLPSCSCASSFSFPHTVPNVLSPRNTASHEKDATLTHNATRDTKSNFFLILEEEPSAALSAPISISMPATATAATKGHHQPFDLIGGVSGFTGKEDEDDNDDDEEEEEGNGGWDALASIDWQQFHIDLLTSDA